MNWQNCLNFLARVSLLFFIVQSNATNIHQECQDVIVNNVVVQPGLDGLSAVL